MISEAIQESSHVFASCSRGTTCVACVESICRWMKGWPSNVMVQPIIRKISFHGKRCEAMNMKTAVVNRNRKMVLERGSLEKFVGGVRMLRSLSWRRLKSSMEFWRSRMLRKKSRESSLTGLTVGAGAMGGPDAE